MRSPPAASACPGVHSSLRGRHRSLRRSFRSLHRHRPAGFLRYSPPLLTMAGSGTGGQQMAGSGMRFGTGARRWRDLRGGAARLVQLGSSIGDNRDANSLVALELHSGRRVWAQQLVHHDLWDAKLPAGRRPGHALGLCGGRQAIRGDRRRRPRGHGGAGR
ncbi:hypothetical protein [Xanthomonas graminis]